MVRETEIKLRVANPERARALAEGHGFTIAKARLFERNLVFDTPANELKKSRRLLRLRDAAGEATLTYKGPPEPGRHKSREEREVRIADFAEMRLILERLGYAVRFTYDKHRTEYRHPREEGTLTVDETPVGTFFELEGEAAWIDRTAAALGFKESDYITASYGSLYLSGSVE